MWARAHFAIGCALWRCFAPSYKVHFFCRFPGIKGNGAEANLDGAEKIQEGITAVKPLQDGAEGADLDGVEKIRRELKWRSCYKTAPTWTALKK